MTGVLIDTLINFVLFSVNQSGFQEWCVRSSLSSFQGDFRQAGNASIPFDPKSDYYNCDRLFQDEVKWSLACVVIHWTLVITSFVGGAFYRVPPPMVATVPPQPQAPPPAVSVGPAEPQPVETNANLKPSNSDIQTYSNMKPYNATHMTAIDIEGYHDKASNQIMAGTDVDCSDHMTGLKNISALDIELGYNDINDIR
ncbi:hypothetical protein DFQ28_007920 [Apophysomyces sp. BC1034]|nr:hypothetical protein DFQ30_007652 [Apophysomyces sp. BC1015]KAG0186404.1 hypothetical protein DFQ28_007920 [Apophysomyces sp. BC1034]